MKPILITGIVILLNVIFVHCEDQKLSISSKTSNGQLKLLCGLFPKLLKDKCLETFNLETDDPDNTVSLLARLDIDVRLNPGIQSDEPSKSSKDSCSICKHIISRLELVINNKKNPAYVQERLLGVCEIYKDPIKSLCISFYKGVGLQVIQAVLKSEHPKKVCQIIKLCTKMNENKDHLEFLDQLADSIQPGKKCPCLQCIKRIKFLEHHIDNSKHVIEVQKKFLGYCEIYKAPIQTFCQFFFYTRGYRLIEDVLRKKEPIKICRYLHHCSKKNSEDKSLIPQTGVSLSTDMKGPIDGCKICRSLVGLYEILINKSRSALVVQKSMIAACNMYKDPVKSQCVTFYKGVGFEVIKAILALRDPTKVCQIMKLCLKVDADIPFMKFIDLIGSLQQTNDLRCKICKSYMKFTEDSINPSKSTDDFVKVSVNICGLYKHPFDKYCKSIYEGLGAFVIMAIQRKENPGKVCKYLHYCPRSDNDVKTSGFGIEPVKKESYLLVVKEIMKSFLKQQSPIQTKQQKSGSSDNKDIKLGSNPVECYLCKQVMEYLKTILKGKNSKEEIEKALLEVCHVVPGQMRNDCDNFVRKYSEKIIDILIKDINDERACSSLQLCSSNDDTLYFMPKNTNYFL